MYKIDPLVPRIDPLLPVSFDDLPANLHRQIADWVMYSPDILGEPLLAVQIAFEDNTPRPDLLALDREGRLVVVELRLGGSQTDLIGRAMGRAAMAARLTRDDIVSLYHRQSGAASRADAIASLDGFVTSTGQTHALNPAGSQRILLVASDVPSDIAATAEWLKSQGIEVGCLHLRTYQAGSDVFVDLAPALQNQAPPSIAAIPPRLAPPDTSPAQPEQTSENDTPVSDTYAALLRGAADRRGLGLASRLLFENAKTLRIASPVPGVGYSLSLDEGEARVRLIFDSAERDQNKARFDLVREHVLDFAATFDDPVDWRRLDDAVESRITIRNDMAVTGEEELAETIDWHLDTFARLEGLMAPILETLSGTQAEPVAAE
ncbi:DUF4268 domain-containing protein [Thalassococcus sp. S3]|uniref:DUF4268 domain-containing protein n=1 Tax=Thalassococcus sp. S3 TaxID=2017482 RepID=UPI00102462D2|nr:DUF4268 domain-containing protein [Thalassococcus sp. S3]QBF33510.1 hypothetical protein CFI11_20180 [Thalassococcus sp. S3]